MKLSARGGPDVSFTNDKETEKKQQFTATNVQPSSLETMKLSQGVTIISKGSKVEGPKPEFETLSKNEYNKKFRLNEGESDNIEDESAIFNKQKTEHSKNQDETKSQKTEKSIASQLKELKHTSSTSFIQINKDMSMQFEDDIDHLESFEAMDMSHRDPNWGKNIS